MSITPQKFKSGGLSGLRAGEGPRLVFIHGVGLCAESYQVQIEAFAGSYEVLAVELPGHGESEMVLAANVTDYANGFEAFLDRPSIVIGHSLGALIALELALRDMPNLRGVIGLNTIFERSSEAAKAVQTRAAALKAGDNDPKATLDRWYGDDYPALREKTRTWLLAGGDGYAKAYSLFANYVSPSRERLAKLTVPARIITGENDRNSTPDMSEALAAVLPNAKAYVVKNGAHMAHMTHADEVNALLAKCLEEIKNEA